VQYLILHVSRTRFDLKTFSSFKDQQHVEFPLEGLDMSPYLDQRGSGIGDQKPSSASAGSYVYDLVSMVVHHGRGYVYNHNSAKAKS